jgi:hypothetical protein
MSFNNIIYFFSEKGKRNQPITLFVERPKAHEPSRRPFMDWGAQRALDVNEYTIHTLDLLVIALLWFPTNNLNPSFSQIIMCRIIEVFIFLL